MPAKRKQQQKISPQQLPERLTPHAAYSGSYFYSPLPPQPYYPYPPYGFPYPMPPPPVMMYPKDYRERSPSPPPRDELHKYLDHRYSRRFFWDIRAPPRTFQCKSSSNAPPDYVNEEMLEDLAISSSEHLQIICEKFKWNIGVKRPSGGHISIKNVLDTIYNTLQEPLTETEWKSLSAGEKRNAHISRGNRIMLDKISFTVDGSMRRIDALGDKTIFSGLKEDDVTDAWLLLLSYRPVGAK